MGRADLAGHAPRGLDPAHRVAAQCTLPALLLGLVLVGCSPPGSSPVSGAQTPAIDPAQSPRVVSITGHALYSKSETEFVFSADGVTYDVTMDLATRCVNLRGSLLGGYQIVSRIILVTSLAITITGPLSGTDLLAQTVLVPTDKDRIT